MNLNRKKPFRRILVIRFSSIGDIVLTSPLVRVLKNQISNVQIDFLVKKEFEDLVENNPNINKVVGIPSSLSFRDLLSFKEHLFQNNDYDLIVDLHDSVRSRILTYNVDIPLAKYNKNRFYRWLYVYWKIETPVMTQTITDKYFNSLQSLGIENDNKGPEFFLPGNFEFACKENRQLAEQFRNADFPVTVAPGAAWRTKQWLPERFARVCNTLVDEFGATVGLLGGASERAVANQISAQIRHKKSIINFVGNTNILESAKLLRYSRLHIANDSGLTHIARALNTNVIVILGGTTRKLGFFQRLERGKIIEDEKLKCRPCSHIGRPRCPLKHFQCMKNVQVQEVVKSIKELALQ